MKKMIFLWTFSILILLDNVVESFPQRSPTSFKKDFSANLDEVKQFGGDFLPKFEFEEFFKKVDETKEREGRRNDLPEFVPARSSEAFNSDRKVVKLLRRKIPEPNEMSERQIGLRRADNNVPLFRGTVEQVLDNRTLKPDSQEYIAPGPPYHILEQPSREFESRRDVFQNEDSRSESLTDRSNPEPEDLIDRKSQRPGLVSDFVRQPFQIPAEFRSGFGSGDLTEFKAPFGDSGSGFANFLKQVGSRADAFGTAELGDRNDRLVVDDIEELKSGIENRRPVFPGQRRTNFGSQYDDDDEFESSDDEEEDDETDRQFYVGNYKPTFRKSTTETEADQSFFSYDNSENKKNPSTHSTHSSYERPYQYSYHSGQNFDQKPEYYFSNERSDSDLVSKQPTPATENRSPEFNFNFRDPFPSIAPIENRFPVDRRKEESELEVELSKISEEPTSIFREQVDDVKKEEAEIPDIKNGFFSNYQVQDFTKVTPPTTQSDISLPRSDNPPSERPSFGFRPFENFNSFFENDISFEKAFESGQNPYFGFNEPRLTSFAPYPATTVATTTLSTSTTASYTKPTYQPPTTTTSTTTATTSKPYKSETEPTSSPVFYKPFDKNDPNFTPGPIYYKPIEIVTTTPTTAAYSSESSTPKSTTQGWKPKVGNKFVDVNAAPKADTFDSYGAPIQISENSYTAPVTEASPKLDSVDTYVAPKSETPAPYSAPKTEIYGEPKDDQVDTYGAPKPESKAQESYGSPKEETVDTYRAPKPETKAPESYGQPKAEEADTYGAPKAEPVDTYGSPKAEPVDSYGSPKAEPLKASASPPAAPAHAPATAANQPARNQQRPRRLTPLGRVVNGVRIMMEEQRSRLKQVRNNHIVRSAAVLLPYAASTLI